MYEDLTSESRTLLYILISSLLSFRHANIRYLELNIPQVWNVFLIFKEYGNSNDCSKTKSNYSDFLFLELKNIVGILECVLPELNIEESRLLAILLDRNSKHAGQAQRLLSEMYMPNSDGARGPFLEAPGNYGAR